MEMCLFRAIILQVRLKKPKMWIDHGIVIKTNITMIFKTAEVYSFINHFYTKCFEMFYILSFFILK